MAGMDKIGQCIKIGLADPPIQWLDSWPLHHINIEQTWPLFVIQFSNFRHKKESNWDRTNRRGVRWPLNHGTIKLFCSHDLIEVASFENSEIVGCRIFACFVWQWLWHCRKSGHFQLQKSAVRILSSETFIQHLFTLACWTADCT